MECLRLGLAIGPEKTERVPLTSVAGGVVLVEGMRVPLDMVVEEFNEGTSPEEIVLGYSTLDLSAVYAILAYYLRHRETVDAYVLQRRQDAQSLRNRVVSG